MKVWPIDPLVPRNLRLEVPEKLPQGLTLVGAASLHPFNRSHSKSALILRFSLVASFGYVTSVRVGSPDVR